MTSAPAGINCPTACSATFLSDSPVTLTAADVPTLSETVMPGFDILGWAGMFGPANMPPESVKVLADALEKALANLEVSIKESGATISRTALPRLRMYEFQLQQVFQNLIANAIHYRGDAVPEVHISTKLQDARWFLGKR